MALLHMDPPVIMNLKKIRRLMDKFNLSCPYRGPNPYRRMAKALKTSNVADNLLQREFEAYGPRIVLLTDITYLPYNGTFAYLSTILDAFTKHFEISHYSTKSPPGIHRMGFSFHTAGLMTPALYTYFCDR